MPSDLPRRALITGASRGIGKATALALAKADFELALVSRSLDNLKSTTAELESMGIQAKAYDLDLSDLESIQPKLAHIVEDFGPLSGVNKQCGYGVHRLSIVHPSGGLEGGHRLKFNQCF
jgi:short-subunit dehydrogenase